MSSIAARSRPNAQLCQCSGNECSLSELKASWRQNLLATFPTAQPRTNNGRCEERSFASGNAPCPTRFSWSSLIQISTQIIDQNYDATLIDVHVFLYEIACVCHAETAATHNAKRCWITLGIISGRFAIILTISASILCGIHGSKIPVGGIIYVMSTNLNLNR